jgi:two-component system, chemotaxis family, chemotaxis protein CheY
MTKILIVDDSPTIRRMVAASLQSLEHVFFEEASNGLEAIEKLAREPINLMILDLNMPDMHGLEVLQFIRTHPQYRGIPIIVLTTKFDAESRKAALERGASRFMTKPFEPTALRHHAASLLEMK